MTITWDEPALVDGLQRQRFEVAAGRRVPGVFWCRPHQAERAALVLVGHGGSQHKESPEVLDFVRPLIERHGFCAAAIDGPVHGARRSDAAAPAAVRDEFLALWRGGDDRIDTMVADWRAAIDALCTQPQVDAGAIGWCGVSMGTAYGLPLVAAEPRIRAALLGMWSAGYPGSARLLVEAGRIGQPVLFQQKWDDTLFDRAGQFALFDAFASEDKRLCVYPGGHTHPAGDQRADIHRFLLSRLIP